MTPKIIPHIFGSLIALERSVKLIEDQNLDTGTESLTEVLSEMRKAANLIQLQFARNDCTERTLKIFYGLLQMVRPIVVDTLREATGERPHLHRARVSNLH